VLLRFDEFERKLIHVPSDCRDRFRGTAAVVVKTENFITGFSA
jgi:hypothetical protein